MADTKVRAVSAGRLAPRRLAPRFGHVAGDEVHDQLGAMPVHRAAQFREAISIGQQQPLKGLYLAVVQAPRDDVAMVAQALGDVVGQLVVMLGGLGGPALDAVLDDGGQQRLFRRIAGVERPLGDAELERDGFHGRRVIAVLDEHLARAVHDRLFDGGGLLGGGTPAAGAKVCAADLGMEAA